MSKDFAAIEKDVAAGIGLLRRGEPDVMKAFAEVSLTARQANALDTKTKELMCVAIGIAVHCEGCIVRHMKGRFKTAQHARRSSKLPWWRS